MGEGSGIKFGDLRKEQAEAELGSWALGRKAGSLILNLHRGHC